MKAKNAKFKDMLEEKTKETTTLKQELEIQTNMVKMLKNQREKMNTLIFVYTCKIYSQKFEDNASFKNHMKKHHLNWSSIPTSCV